MQLPDSPPAKRSLGQTAFFFAAMIGFLVFSDWANPSQTIIEKKDGTRMQVAVMLETTETLRVQIEDRRGTEKGRKVTLAKADIERTERLRRPATSGRFGVRHRWYFAGACFLATLAMVGTWFERDELSEWMGQTWGFAKSIVPLLFGGVLVTGFVGALIPEEVVASGSGATASGPTWWPR